MTKLSFSPLRLILLALLGSAIIIGGAIAAVIALWEPRLLDKMVPTDATVALFSNVTSEDVRLWSDDIPALRSLPAFTSPLDLGVLTLDGGTMGWILTSRSKDIALPSVNGAYRGQDILVSDPGVMGMMTGNAPRLRTYGPFMQLISGMAGNSKQIYLRMKDADAMAALPPLLRPLIHASDAILLSQENDRATVRISGTTAGIPGTITAAIPDLAPAPDAVLTLGNPAVAMDTHLKTLPADQRLIMQGMLSGTIETMIGPGWSWTYNILPLVKDESMLAWKSNTGTGAALSYLLKSVSTDPTETRNRLAAFHDRFRTQLTGTVVTRRALGKGATSAIIHSDPSQIEDRQETRGGWTVHITREKDGSRTLLSATRGREFFMTDRKEWLDQMTGSSQGESLPTVDGSPVAGGILSPELFTQYMKDVIGRPEWRWLMNGIHGRKGTAWGVELTDHVLTISVEKNGSEDPVTSSSSSL